MRKFQGHEIAIGTLVATAVWAVLLVLTSDVASHYQICETAKEGTKQAAKDCTSYNILSFMLREFGAHLDIVSALITAAATAFIARYTFTLKQSTDRLWDTGEKQRLLSEDTAKRQLRAYVIVDGDTFDCKPGKFISKLKIINTGQTPAYEMKVLSKTDILPLPLPNGFDFGLEDPGNSSITILGRDRDVGHESEITTKDVTRQNLGAVLADNATEVIYTYGSATYRDAFGDSHHTNFCFYFAWEKDSVACHVSEYHNDAS